MKVTVTDELEIEMSHSSESPGSHSCTTERDDDCPICAIAGGLKRLGHLTEDAADLLYQRDA